jgi:uncharacterized protein (TIGR00661 family)
VRYIFIVQGEGRGHLTQAIATRDLLERRGHRVVAMLAGTRGPGTLPAYFLERAGCPVTTFDSVYFLFPRAGGRARFARTVARHVARLPALARSVLFLRRRLAAGDADAVINFYEVLAGVTYALFRPRLPCACMAHQYLFLHPAFVFPPDASRLELRALLLFTRLTAARAARVLALSFREMPASGRIRVIPPRVRQEVMRLERGDDGYILGYLLDAGFAAGVTAWHERHPDVPLRFFWNKPGAPPVTRVDDTLTFHQLDATAFIERMARCRGYASTGGFESICEAMYLGKPVLMVPAHVEQECNAFDAVTAGAGVSSPRFDLSLLLDYLPSYRPSPRFVAWADRADDLLMSEL